MECVTGVPFTYSPEGALESCAVPLEVSITSLPELIGELLYLIDRLPTYVVAAGAMVGLIVLVVTAVAVKELMS